MKNSLKIVAMLGLLALAGCAKKAPAGPCDPTQRWCTTPGKVEIEVTKPDMPEFDPFDYQKEDDKGN